jgi:hypothetical protein
LFKSDSNEAAPAPPGNWRGLAKSLIYRPLKCGRTIVVKRSCRLSVHTRRAQLTAGYAVLFSICGFAYLVAFAVNHLLAPRFEPFALAGEHS